MLESESSLKRKNETVLALTFSNWKYLTSTIYLNWPAVKKMTAGEIKRILIHEFCHVLVNEMRERKRHHEERVVTGLTDAFLWTEQFAKEEK